MVFCLFFIGLVAVLGKAFWLQCGISTAFLQKQGEARYARTLPVPAQRGQIFDRNGVVLASTIPARSVWAEPEEALKLTAAQFDRLGALLGESGAEIRGRIEARKNKSFVYIDRQIEVEKGEAVRALQLPGIHVNNEVRRNYPDGPISAHVVGFTDSDNNGREGVELANNEILSGKQGSRRVIRDRLVLSKTSGSKRVKSAPMWCSRLIRDCSSLPTKRFKTRLNAIRPKPVPWLSWMCEPVKFLR